MKFLPFEGRWPPQGGGGVSHCQEGTPKLVDFPGQVIPLRRTPKKGGARHLPSKGRIFAKCNCPERDWEGGCVISIRRLKAPFLSAPVAQLDRASDYESEGRAFESLRAHQGSH
jgi:hypothetical protein